jgi:hypothetical protein
VAEEYVEHTVAEGEDLPKIAVQYRTSADKIWNDPKNVQQRTAKAEAWRKDLGPVPESPYVLEPGDTIWIPPFQPKKVAIETDKLHTFKRKGLRVKVILILRKDGKPRVGKKYELKVEDQTFSGTTGGDGKIEHWVPVTAEMGRLSVEPDPPEQEDDLDPLEELLARSQDGRKEVYEVRLGHLDPVSTDRGLRARLHNLGFLEQVDGGDDELEQAIRDFNSNSRFE